MFFAGVLDTEIVNYEAEHDWPCFMSEEAWSVLGLLVSSCF